MEATQFLSQNFSAEHARTMFRLSEALLQDNHQGSQEEAERLQE
jgi:hypothetical protein